MPHIHITEGDKLLATIGVRQDGSIYHEGAVAQHFIHELKHKHAHDGKALLDSIVRKLDSSTMIAARYCDKDHTVTSAWQFPSEEERTSTEPTEVLNPEDGFPEFGQANPDQQKHDIEWSEARHAMVRRWD